MTQPAVDWCQLLSSSGGDPIFEEEVLSSFMKDTEQHLQCLKLLMEGLSSHSPSPQTLEAIYREAHHLKGSSGEVGAQVMHGLAAQLYTQAHLGEVDPLPALFIALEAAYADAKQQFLNHLRDIVI